MAEYIPRNIPNGHKLTAEDLAHIESGVAGAYDYTDEQLAALPEGVTSVNGQTGDVMISGDGSTVDLTGYATETYVDDAVAAAPTADLTGYATKTYVNDAVSAAPAGAPQTYAVEAVKGAGHLALSQARGAERAAGGAPLPPPMVDGNFDGQKVRLTFPTRYDWSTPLPLLIMFNGSGTADLDPFDIYAQPLADAGVIVAKSTFHGQHHGSPTAMADVQNLYEWALRQFPISGVIIHGNSMGGLGALNALTTGAIPNILGVYLVDPSTNLRHRWDNGRAAEITAAYGIAGDGSNYGTKTDGYDPNLQPALDFRGVPIRIIGSTGDETVPLQQHGLLLEDKLGAQVEVWDRATAGHNTGDRFEWADLLDYIRRWVGRAALPEAVATDRAFDFNAATLPLGPVTSWVPQGGTHTTPLSPINAAPEVVRDSELGVNVVRFPDTNAGSSTPSHLATATYAAPINSPATVFIVLRDRMASGDVPPLNRRYISGTAWNDHLTLGASDTSLLRYSQPGSAIMLGDAVPTGWTVAAFCSNGASSWMRMGNSVKTFSLNPDAAARFARLRIGAEATGGANGLTGSVARVIGFSRALTTAETDAMFAELAEQYNPAMKGWKSGSIIIPSEDGTLYRLGVTSDGSLFTTSI